MLKDLIYVGNNRKGTRQNTSVSLVGVRKNLYIHLHSTASIKDTICILEKEIRDIKNTLTQEWKVNTNR